MSVTAAQRTQVSSLLHTSVCSHFIMHRPAKQPRRASFKALKEFSSCQPGLKTYSVKATFFLDTFRGSQLNLKVAGVTPSGHTWMSAAHVMCTLPSALGFPRDCSATEIMWAPSSTLHQRWHKALQVHRSWLVTEIQHRCHRDFHSFEELSSEGKFSKLLHSKGTKFGGYFFYSSHRKFQEVGPSGCSYLHSSFCHLSALPWQRIQMLLLKTKLSFKTLN